MTNLKLLIELTKMKKNDNIKQLLEGEQTKKGTLFEEYIAELLNGNGYLAKRVGKKGDQGVDVLLFDSKNPEAVVKSIQVKNHNKPLDEFKLSSQIHLFNEKGEQKYNCKYYTIYSLNGYTSSCEGYDEFNIELNNWEDIKTLIDNYESSNNVIPKVPLLPHNEATFSRVIEKWKKVKRVCAVQATGTGKTFIIVSAIKKNTGRKLVLAPFNKILDQIYQKGAWVDSQVDYLTYNRLNYKINEMHNSNYDLIVLDEFHRAGAKKWGASVNKLLKFNPETKVLGTTATPVRSNGVDMSEALFNNEVVTKISLADAIVREILPNPKYVVAVYEIDDIIKRMDETVDIFKKNKRIKAKYKKEIEQFKINWESVRGMPEIIKKHIKSERKFIVFCKDINHLNNMKFIVSNWFQKAQVAEEVIHFTSTSHNYKDADEQIKLFEKQSSENKIVLLFTIDRANEGIHISSVDGVILLRSTNSNRIYLQQIGRSFESGSNKTPLIFDLVNNFETLEEFNFMADLDNAMNEHNTKRTNKKLPPKYIQFKLTDETKNILNYKEDLENRLKDPWYDMFETLVEYKENNGNVLTYFMQPNLKQWCNAQRIKYKSDLLIENKFKLLKEQGFIFSKDEDKWWSIYEEARKFYKNTGPLLVNRYHESEMGELLKNWICETRKLYKKGEIDINKIENLKLIAFDFDGNSDEWYLNYNMIKEIYSEEIKSGQLIVDDTFAEDDVQWLSKQRELFMEGQLSIEKIKLLKDINFELDKKIIIFEEKAIRFSHKPSDESSWGDYIYQSYKNDKLNYKEISILKKYDIYNVLINTVNEQEKVKKRETEKKAANYLTENKINYKQEVESSNSFDRDEIYNTKRQKSKVRLREIIVKYLSNLKSTFSRKT